MQVIPAVDVLDRRAVRLLRGDYTVVSDYALDPVAAAGAFMRDGASLVHVVDLSGAKGGRSSSNLPSDLARAGVRFQIGGGIRTRANAIRAIEDGAERVVVGSALVDDPAKARDIVRAIGSERVVAAVDVRDGRARGSGWTDDGLPVTEMVRGLFDAGIVRALVTGIETDGTMEGPAFDIFERVRELAPDLNVIASGGVGSLDDIRSLAGSSVEFEGVIIGRAIYEDRFSMREALAAAIL